MKKKVILGICCLFMLVGLVSCQSEEKEYVRDTRAGEVIQINLDTMEKMLEEEGTFVVVFGTHTCGYCIDFSIMVQEYLKGHHVKIYNVYLDDETTSANENRERITTHFETFSNTPGIFYVKDGENTSHLKLQQERITEAYFDDWVQKHQMDNKN